MCNTGNINHPKAIDPDSELIGSNYEGVVYEKFSHWRRQRLVKVAATEPEWLIGGCEQVDGTRWMVECVKLLRSDVSMWNTSRN